MHTLTPDAHNLLELVQGYCAAEKLADTASIACPLAVLEIADLLTEPLMDTTYFSLRNLVVVLDDVGQTSPYLAELFAGHYGIALALLFAPGITPAPQTTWSLNGSNPQASMHVVADFPTGTVTYGAPVDLTATKPLPVDFAWLRQSVWLCHSAALVGTLSRVRKGIGQTINPDALQLAETAARSLVQAAAERQDHALGRGPYANTPGYGARYDNDTFTTTMRQSVFAFLDCLMEHCQAELAAALQVVYGRAVTGFGGLTESIGRTVVQKE